MYFIYLVPALVLFACRRVPARRRRALRRNFDLVTTYFKGKSHGNSVPS
jgi:hypothetical protein